MAALLTYVGRAWVLALVAVELASALVPLALIAVIGALVARVSAGAAIALPLALLTVLLLLQQVLAPLRSAASYVASRGIDGALRGRVMATANRSVGIGPLEDGATQDRLFLAGGDIDTFWSATPGHAAVALVATGARYLQAAGAAALVALASAPLAIGMLAVVLTVRSRFRRWNAVRARAFRDSLPHGRVARYTASLATAPPGAKEVRLFAALEWLQARHRRQWAVVQNMRGSAGRWSQIRIAGTVLLLAPVIAVAFVVVGSEALVGEVDAGGLAVALQATLLVVTLLEVRNEEHHLDFGLESLAALRQVEDQIGPEPTRPTIDASGMPGSELRFEGVAFRYPGGDGVFTGLDLTIAAGTSLAIVGANGAGKTTLIKLLARLYEPDAGRITVDGIDLSDLDPVSWRERLAVIFQDFVHYELSAADNVALGGLRLDGAREALHRAATRAGALGVVEGLPFGWDTPLSRQYQGGTELSGGEWQRIALARALFAVEAGAGVLVLDEPTANLDVRAEAELFDRFLELTSGLTTILISHRFSTVRRADRICVLEGGQVIEDGSHEVLMGAGGRYSELFGLQAARFHG